MTKLVYIDSLGHSGSTLLDILCGTIPQVTSTGECFYLPWQLYRNKYDSEINVTQQNVCSCAKSFRDCQIWSRIITKMSEKVGFDIYEDPFRFRMALLRSQIYGGGKNLYERILHGLYSCSVRVSCISSTASLWRMAARKAIENNWLLFDTVSEICNGQYVVDSSKGIIRMHMLRSLRPTDVYLIILIRDVRGVAASALKRGDDPLKYAAVWFNYYPKVLKIVMKTPDLPVLLLNYEELCNDPIKLRKRIADFLGLPDPGERLSINTHDHHLVAGNPMRYKGNIDIKCDKYWHKALDKKLCLKLQFYNEELAKNIGKLLSHE